MCFFKKKKERNNTHFHFWSCSVQQDRGSWFYLFFAMIKWKKYHQHGNSQKLLIYPCGGLKGHKNGNKGKLRWILGNLEDKNNFREWKKVDALYKGQMIRLVINAVFCSVLWPTDTPHFLATDSDMYSKLTSGLFWNPKHIFLSKLCVTNSEETHS